MRGGDAEWGEGGVGKELAYGFRVERGRISIELSLSYAPLQDVALISRILDFFRLNW